MEGTFMSIYENKIKDIGDNSEELTEYLLKCLPFIQSYTDTNEIQNVEVDPIFNTIKTQGVQRQQILRRYLKHVENIDDITSTSHDDIIQGDNNCERCGSYNIHEDIRQSDTVCYDCGFCQQYISEELTYKEEQESSEIVFNNAYKRDNHLNEWILQFQGKESTNIPDEVLTQLRIELKKEKINDLKQITPNKVKSLLRKLRYSKYYEHATYIANSLTGIKPPVMSEQLDAKIRQMFREIQDPFEKHCPSTRSNFLSYSYVIYKFCELLGEDDYLPFFPLLKSKEKLRQQDVIWKCICNELQWEFIATV